ncbi:acid-sensing ion channel 3 [Exaiptasia diaphana]|uniref:Uncharacterized protein n=1 Tax=Exaiptasia diaphana TaxID=2652724 RepID=A0A913YR24_EXADI|nr:acid-sensing ion channel 3 [Exaiptasia diaphana]XP_028516586.1 acid-sensing ion channel 3 [Exaiptasia diaphana]
MMRKSRIIGTDAEVFLDKLNIFKKVFSPNESANKTLSSSFDIEKAVKEFGHNAKDMMKVCTWDGKLCNSRNVTTRFSQMYGLCHTFNPGKEHHPLLFSTSVKRNRALHLLLDIDVGDYFGITSYFSTGIRMVIHDQDEEPMVEANGIDASPGHMITMNIERREYISLPSPYKSECGSRPLETSKSYTQSKCLMECETRKVIRQCGCKLLGMADLPGFKGSKYCNPEELTSCLFANLTIEEGQNIETVLAKFSITYDSSFSSDNPKEECNCPKPCKKIQYKIAQLNTVTALSESFWNDYYSAYKQNSPNGDSNGYIKAIVDRERKRIRENWLTLIIYYGDLHTVRTTEKVAYDMTDFGSDVRGYLGLFLGCSVLTVFEIFDFILCYYLSKQRASFEVEQVRETNEKM